MFNLVDGLIRIGLFLVFIWGVSLFRDIRRVYQYHGAEHKTVFAFEMATRWSCRVQKYSTFHPRCGTSFLMTVMLISIAGLHGCSGDDVLGALRNSGGSAAGHRRRLYEMIRFAAKHRGSFFALLTAPGLWLQRITTKPPSDDQAECAIAALNKPWSSKNNGAAN